MLHVTLSSEEAEALYSGQDVIITTDEGKQAVLGPYLVHHAAEMLEDGGSFVALPQIIGTNYMEQVAVAC